MNRGNLRRMQLPSPRVLMLAGGALVFGLFLLSLFAGCTLEPETNDSIGLAPKSVLAATHSTMMAHLVLTQVATTGCGKPSPIPSGTSANESLRVDGLLRAYRLHVPRGYTPDQHVPLVLSFHGHTSNSRAQERYTGFSTLADQHGFLVAYPQGVVGPDGKTGWNTGRAKDPKTNDLLFVSDLISRLQTQFCVNPQRIYATGFSNGGGMTALLACHFADRIAAFAPVSGDYVPQDSGCHPSRPVSILEIHGTSDKVVPYGGSRALSLPPLVERLAGWAQLDGCTHGPTIFYQQGPITGEKWTGCRDGAEIIHYRLTGGKHTWPANFIGKFASVPADRFPATEIIWRFFEAHALPLPQFAAKA